MNSSSITPDAYPLGATSAYIAFLPISEDSILPGARNKGFSFIHQPPYQRQTESTIMLAIALSESTKIEWPFVLKPTPTLQELLNGPLFQVAGIFEIDEPGWADKIDEYIAETYL